MNSRLGRWIGILLLNLLALGCGGGGGIGSGTIGEAVGTAVLDLYAGSKPAVQATGKQSEATIQTPDGRTRRYRLYVPSALQVTSRVPLMIALHGALGSSSQFQSNSGFNELAEANGFIVAYPDGIGNLPDESGFQTWNAGSCCGPAQSKAVDDVHFIDQLIDTISLSYPIDPTRVYAAGHSNGAMLSYRLACELSSKIVAIGIQAGSPGVESCPAPNAVSMLHIHGTADLNMPISGGAGSQGVSGVSFRPALDADLALSVANSCKTQSSPVAVSQNADLVATTFGNCRGSAEIKFIAVTGASHAWMGHEATSAAAAALVGVPYTKLDSSRAIWSFLNAHPRN